MQSVNFRNGTYLGDVYQVGLGYLASFSLRYGKFPGLSIRVGGMGASLNSNRFLGNFYEGARLREHGIFVYQQVPVFHRISLLADFGLGWMSVIHGYNVSRFALNFSSLGGAVGFSYNIFEDEKEKLPVSFFIKVRYGGVSGKGIRINPDDQVYLQNSTFLSASIGCQIQFH
ncbi:hypothetical protein [Algoriphagus namhaensis]